MLPGLQFRRHYFLLALPAVGLLSGAAVTALAQRTAGAVAALVFLAALAVTAYLDRDLIYRATPAELCRKIYGPNPFPEAERIAGFIEVRSKPDDRIAVFGSEPEILFLARRASATGYLYTYPLMEPQRRAPDMQRGMVTEVEAARPAFLVYVNVPSSWLVRPESDTAILDWMRGFCERQYRLVGAVEIVSAETTRFLWNESAASFQPETPNYVLIYERRE